MPHLHEKIDFTVEVFIVYKNKIFLRMHDKYGIWLSVGGHIELDEDPNQAAVREVMEETGLAIELIGQLPKRDEDSTTDLIPPRYLNRHFVKPGHEHLALVYFAVASSDQITVQYKSDASNEWKWVTRDELNKMELRPNVRFYAEHALAELSSTAE